MSNEMLKLADMIEQEATTPGSMSYNGMVRVAAILRAAASAEPVAVRLEARPADNSQEWVEIFPAQLEWVAKEGHQVRAVESTHPAPDAEIVAALEDVFSHQDVWRRLLVAQQTPIGSDDDGSYWAHELTVFDRTFAALAKAKGVHSAGGDGTFDEGLQSDAGVRGHE